MTREEAIENISNAISVVEGFAVTEAQAKARGIRYPTLAIENMNPGNVRRWRNKGKQYPTRKGYVDFVAWAGGDPTVGEVEGWRVLHALVGQYIDGKMTGGKPPSLAEMFRVYAPAEDSNNPASYAQTVAKKTGIPVDVPIKSLITENPNVQR